MEKTLEKAYDKYMDENSPEYSDIKYLETVRPMVKKMLESADGRENSMEVLSGIASYFRLPLTMVYYVMENKDGWGEPLPKK